MTSGKEFYNEHLKYIQSGDLDGLMRNHYHEDVELVTFDFVLKGRDAVRRYLEVDSPAKMGRVLGLRTLYFAATDDVIMVISEVNSEKLGYFQARDAYYLKDGKILRHIGLTLPPDEDRRLKLGREPASP
jgi:hypothetical protein